MCLLNCLWLSARKAILLTEKPQEAPSHIQWLNSDWLKELWRYEIGITNINWSSLNVRTTVITRMYQESITMVSSCKYKYCWIYGVGRMGQRSLTGWFCTSSMPQSRHQDLAENKPKLILTNKCYCNHAHTAEQIHILQCAGRSGARNFF